MNNLQSIARKQKSAYITFLLPFNEMWVMAQMWLMKYVAQVGTGS